MHFRDGIPVPRKNKVNYQGCFLNQTSDTTKELNQRISTCMAVLNRLHIFWRHSNCPVGFKLQALSAVVRTKLLYGLESAQLNQTAVNRINTFQLKGLRKILQMPTTFAAILSLLEERQNYSNDRVIETANQSLAAEGKKRVELFEHTHAKTKTRSFAETVKSHERDPVKTITFTDELKPWSYANKRHGRPKAKWADEAAKLYWAQIRHNLAPGLQSSTFDFNNPTHREQLISYVQSSEGD